MTFLHHICISGACALLLSTAAQAQTPPAERLTILKKQCIGIVEKQIAAQSPAVKLQTIDVSLMAITGSKFACLVKGRDLAVPDGKLDRESIMLYAVATDVQTKAGTATPIPYTTTDTKKPERTAPALSAASNSETQHRGTESNHSTSEEQQAGHCDGSGDVQC